MSGLIHQQPDIAEPASAGADELPPIFAQLDGNGDGRLTRAELQRLTQLFERLDSNQDGALTADELRYAERTSGPQDERSFQGIYEFDGEVLKWCVSNRGRQRPQAMATDRGNYLLILRQQQ